MQISGRFYWAKILGKPVPKYKTTPADNDREWAVDVGNLTLDTKKALKDAGLLSRVKNKMDEREDFISFRVSEYQAPVTDRPDEKYPYRELVVGKDYIDPQAVERLRKKGVSDGDTVYQKKNDPIKVVNVEGLDWDHKTLIGNGSEGDAKFNVVPAGDKVNAYLGAIRVRALVVYESDGPKTEYEDLDEWGDVSFPVKATKPSKVTKDKNADLDDEQPF